MPSTAIAAPGTFSAHEADGLQATFTATTELLLTMQDRIDPIQTGMVSLLGDLAGSGSDEMRVTWVDGIEFDERFAALGGETDVPTPTGNTLGYTVLTIATYGMAKAETHRAMMLNKPGTYVSVQDSLKYIPGSFLSTLRYLGCVAGSGISSIIGSASDDLTADDWYLLREAMITTLGSSDRGMPAAWLHPEQFNQLSASFRSEPAYVQAFEQWRATAAVIANTSQVFPNFAGMGVDIRLSGDVVLSGSAYHGFVGAPGFMGWGRASTSRIKIAAAASPIRLDQYGVLIYDDLDAQRRRTNQINAYAEIGVVVGDPLVYFQRRLRSRDA